MDIQNINAATNQTLNAAPAAITSDYQTFLKMLTTQMQYQDPLNPTDAGDYAVQLATFSQVEQTTKTNALLTSVLSQFGVMSMSQLAGWVGQEALTESDVYIGTSGEPITVVPHQEKGADRMMLFARDKADKIVVQAEIPLNSESYDWSPVDAQGKPFAVGEYKLTLENYSGGTLLSAKPVEHYGVITEVRLQESGAALVLNGGVSVLATDIKALRHRVPTTLAP